MIVMAGATGFSYKAHYCHGNLSGIALYPEYGIPQTISCGCDNESSQNSNTLAGYKTTFSKKNCCSNITFFSKLNIESPVKYFSSIFKIQSAAIAVFCWNTVPLPSTYKTIPVTKVQFASKALAGRKLVLFLSQQRIPLIGYN